MLSTNFLGCVTVLPPVMDHSFTGVGHASISSNIRADFHLGDASSATRAKIAATLSDYLPRIASRASHSDGIVALEVRLREESDASAVPTVRTNEAYELHWTSSMVRVTASSVSGIVYGLGTLAQLTFATGRLPSPTGTVSDSPRYPHRGLLVDTGRRFWPLSLLKQTVRAMAASKLNVLHLHFSDNCRFAIESITHPEILPADGQYLTQAQVMDLIDFAASHGVRVVPEIDLPGHARGMAAAVGVTWADDSTRVQMKDSEGTRAFLSDILTEFAELFPDEYFHIGADETDGTPTAIIDFAIRVLRSLGKQVVGWEEAHFVSEAGTPSSLIIQAWKKTRLDETNSLMFKSIYSKYTDGYLDIRPSIGQLWRMGAALEKDHSDLVLGGEVAMWTDSYCPLPECYNRQRPPTLAAHLFHASADAEFAESINRMMWPKTAVGASAFWNYKADVAASSLPLRQFSTYLEASFGIKGCMDTEFCRCSLVSACDPDEEAPGHVEYHAEVLELPSAPVGVGMYSTSFASWGVADGALSTYYMDNEWFSGDLNCYYVDAFYSQEAFAHTAGIEAGIRQFRAGASPDSTLWLVFDDGGKADPVIARGYLRHFVKWVRRLESVGHRRFLGKIGVGINVESLTGHELSRMVGEELNVVRDKNTRLELLVYEDQSAETMHAALRLADVVGVFVSGTDEESLIHSIAAFMYKYRSALHHTRAAVTFMVHAPLSGSVQSVARRVFDALVDQEIMTHEMRSRLFDARNFLGVYSWENWIKSTSRS